MKLKHSLQRKTRIERVRIGATQKKILLLLLSGLALAYTRSPKNVWRIIKGTEETWKEINYRAAS